MTTVEAPVSRTVDLDGDTHYLDFGGPATATPVVCVHGFGGAAWNWLALGPLLAGDARVLVPDLAGHGLSPAMGRSTTIGANRRLLDRFVREVVGEPVILVGNSMGGLIAMLEAAAAPEMVRAAVLIDPALPRVLLSPVEARTSAQFAMTAAPLLGATMYARRRRRINGEQIVRMGLSVCTVDIDRVPPEVFTAAVQSLRQRDQAMFPAADMLLCGRSIMRRMTRVGELRRAMSMITAPVLLIHGEKDRLVPYSAARRTARWFPHWRFEVARDVGHVPMLEAPRWTADVMLDFLRDDVGLVA